MTPVITRLSLLALSLLAALLVAAPVFAHQPFFEEKDITASAPWPIKDPDTSTVVYATLEDDRDIDYFSFSGKVGQRILLSLTIPQIEGQDDFAPMMALVGPGLGAEKLPAEIALDAGAGALLLPPPAEASPFFEPFSRTSYWTRQETQVSLPAAGTYTVAVWHHEGRAGRYGFVIGERERLGGDLAFGRKLKAFWTPVAQPTADPKPASPHAGCGGHLR